jgi:hypothetical protein
MYFEEPKYPFPPCAQREYDKYMKLFLLYWNRYITLHKNQWHRERINRAHMNGLIGLPLIKLGHNRKINKWLKAAVKAHIRAVNIAEIWNKREIK